MDNKRECIKIINNYLKSQLWMDFELYNIDGLDIVLVGRLDENGSDKIKIIFKRPYAVICTILFTYEGNGDFISLVTGAEAKELNKKYGVLQEKEIFKISDTDINSDMYIIAEEIEVEVL